MATKTDPPAGPPAGDPPTGGTPPAAVPRDDLKTMIREVLQETTVTGPAGGEGAGSSRATNATREKSVADQVAEEVARIAEAEKRRARDTTVDAQLAELGATVKKIAEPPPVQYRKITQRLWGDRK